MTKSRSKYLIADVLSDESGQDIVEYALLAAVIALGSVVALKSIATGISGVFGTIGTKMTNNTT